jgi:hypothetical protein
MVTTTIVAGQILMQDRELTMLDEKEILCNAREHALQVWKRYENSFVNEI